MKELTLSGEVVLIGPHPVKKIHGGFGDGQPCILAKQVAELHGQEIKDINRLVNNNKDWFEEGIDIIDLKPVVVSNHHDHASDHHGYIADFLLEFYSREGLNRSTHIYLFSQQGYALLCKLLKSDLAKQIYKQMVRDYFRMQESLNIVGAGGRMTFEQFETAFRCYKMWLEILDMTLVPKKSVAKFVANDMTRDVAGVDFMDFIYPYLFSAPKHPLTFAPSPVEDGDEEEALMFFLTEWRHTYGGKAVSSRELCDMIDDEGIPLDLGTGNDHGRKVRLGKMLAKLAGQEIGDYRICEAGKRKGTRVWRLEEM